MPDKDEDARNWAQARQRVDSGQTGDKVAAADPASVPLGTDAEAGGNDTPAEDVNRSVRHQEEAAAHDAKQRRGDERRWRVSTSLIVTGIVVAVAVIALAFASTS